MTRNHPCQGLSAALCCTLAIPVLAQGVKILPKPVPLALCSDLVSKLEVLKAPDGSLQMTGRISNEGPGSYANTSGPLQAFFMVYTWHPPKTPAQEGDLKLYGHTLLGTKLKAKETKIVQYHYQIEKFSRWGSYPPSQTERPAMKQVCVRVERKSPIGFSKCEDSNLENTTACLDFPYMEKLP